MAVYPFLVHLNLNQNEIQNAVFQNLSAAPESPKEGQFFYDSTNKVLKYWDGTKWNSGNAGNVIASADLTDGNLIKGAGSTNVADSGIAIGNVVTAAADLTDEKIVLGSGSKGIEASSYGIATAMPATPDDASVLTNKGVADYAVQKNTAITAGTNCKITYDAKGLVTAGAALEASDIPDISATYIATSQKGVANGVATLGSDGLVPTGQLPSYVDDVIEAYVVGSTPLASNWLSLTEGGSALTPENGKIYVIIGPAGSAYLNKQYRWGGTVYVLCNPSDVQSVNGKTGVVTLTQDDIGDGTTYVQFSAANKTKLDGIAEGATANTITLNGTATADPTFYAPTAAGTEGQYLIADANGVPAWGSLPSTLTKKFVVANPALTPSAGEATWTVNHALNTQDVEVKIRQVASPYNEVMAEVVYTDANNVTIKFNAASAIAASTYKAIVIG